jgi:hypothetical protein
MQNNSFPYSFSAKILGIVIIMAGVVMFFLKYARKGIFDFNELAIGFSWGLVFVFFSKERTDDEMMQGLKFRALARAIVTSFFATHIYNYLFLNWRFERPDGIILSISAYQFLAITLVVATALFYYMKHQIALTDRE